MSRGRGFRLDWAETGVDSRRGGTHGPEKGVKFRL